MSTNGIRPQPDGSGVAAETVFPDNVGAHQTASDGTEEAARKASGYGLPCSKCHLYYSADLAECPTCHNKERVSADTPKTPIKPAQTVQEPVPDSATLEKEREDFLRQFKSQLLQAHAEMMTPAESTCKFVEHHPGEPSEADVCTSCYERLQERLDICEAALHMDVKEAAQIVYEAVWADPSDPGKTYQNAASALLTELRKRAGITAVMGAFQTLTH